jgi:hypothetical protein
MLAFPCETSDFCIERAGSLVRFPGIFPQSFFFSFLAASKNWVRPETRHGAGSYLRSLENRIRERAYAIWTAHGCIDGQADQCQQQT